MSYCIAWKKNEQVFMLSESAISSFEDDIQAGISTFGEVQGLYGKYYVQEGLLKIIKINDDFVLGVSGDVPTIIELLTYCLWRVPCASWSICPEHQRPA